MLLKIQHLKNLLYKIRKKIRVKFMTDFIVSTKLENQLCRHYKKETKETLKDSHLVQI